MDNGKLDKVIKALDQFRDGKPSCDGCPYDIKSAKCLFLLHSDALELLKEQEEQKRKWLRNIADNQLANAPKDRKEFMSLDEHMEYQYQLGVYDGLQMAWDILTEDDNVH